MAALPYMQFFVADYLADTMHLTTEEHGAYLLLIFNYWQTGKALPNNDKRLSIIAGLDSERWTNVKQTLAEFFVVSEENLTHPRIEADLQFVEDKQNKAILAGKASAVARAAKKKVKTNTRSTIVGTSANNSLQPEGNHKESYSQTEHNERLKDLKKLAAGSREHKLCDKYGQECGIFKVSFDELKFWAIEQVREMEREPC